MRATWTSWLLKTTPIGCPETSVHNYHSTLRNISSTSRWKPEITRSISSPKKQYQPFCVQPYYRDNSRTRTYSTAHIKVSHCHLHSLHYFNWQMSVVTNCRLVCRVDTRHTVNRPQARGYGLCFSFCSTSHTHIPLDQNFVQNLSLSPQKEQRSYRAAESGSEPGEYIPPPSSGPSKGRPAKNLYTTSERLISVAERPRLGLKGSICAIHRSWHCYEHSRTPGPLLDLWVPVICTGFPPLSSGLRRSRNLANLPFSSDLHLRHGKKREHWTKTLSTT
jgi:hypothetical protein